MENILMCITAVLNILEVLEAPQARTLSLIHTIFILVSELHLGATAAPVARLCSTL